VVLRGREPGIELANGAEQVTLANWAETMFVEMSQVATLFDKANQTNEYTKAVELEYKKINDPNLTPSAMMLNTMLDNNEDNSVFGKRLAEQHKQQLLSRAYEHYTAAEFDAMQRASIERQQEIESADTVDFSTFLSDYLTY
jgi:glutamate--cysteine ligase